MKCNVSSLTVGQTGEVGQQQRRSTTKELLMGRLKRLLLQPSSRLPSKVAAFLGMKRIPGRDLDLCFEWIARTAVHFIQEPFANGWEPHSSLPELSVFSYPCVRTERNWYLPHNGGRQWSQDGGVQDNWRMILLERPYRGHWEFQIKNKNKCCGSGIRCLFWPLDPWSRIRVGKNSYPGSGNTDWMEPLSSSFWKWT